jgi:SLA1 homology domain 1, SHD1
MPGSKSRCGLPAALLVILVVLLLTSEASAQTNRKAPGKTTGKAPAKGAVKAAARPTAAFTEALGRARSAGRPLIVFGWQESCGHCAALKQALATQPALQLLMTQYTLLEIPFGKADFVSVWDEAGRQDAQYAPSIGSPGVFIFTAKGDVVFAGPRLTGQLPLGDGFNKLLIAGIEKNGGLRGGAPSPPANLVSDARKVLAEGQPLSAGAMLAPYAANEGQGELADLVKLTGLQVAKAKNHDQLQALVEEVSAKSLSLLEACVAAAGTDATRAAVQLAELDRVFSGYPALAGKFDAAWKEVLAKSDVARLKDQAERLDKARQAERTSPPEAIAAYQRVCTDFPGTKAAELAQLRVAQLQAPKAALPRLWKSNLGQFSVTATLVSFDGKSATLRTDQGKTITVLLEALSGEDQEFLNTTKPQN